MYTVIIKFETLENLLSEIKDYFSFCKEDGDQPDYFRERKKLKSDIFSLVADALTWNGENIEVYSIEIQDCYLDEFLSKFEPEFWASIETIKEEIFK